MGFSMNDYTLTILYSCHAAEKNTPLDFSMSTLASGQIQVITVQEDDIYDPRRNTLNSIPKAEGAFTIILDAGDRLSPSFLDRMLEAAKQPGISFVMPSLICSHVPQPAYFSLAQPVDLTINTDTDQSVFPMELHGLMFHTKALQEACRQTASLPEREKQMLLLLLKRNPSFFYLGSCSCTYAQPRECDASYNMKCFTREWYYEPLEQFLLPLFEDEQRRHGQAGRLIQYMALHMIQIRINANTNNNNKHIIPVKDVPEYMELLSRIMQFIETEVLLSNNCRAVISLPIVKFFYLQLKKRDFSYYPELVCETNDIKLKSDEAEFGSLSLLPVCIRVLDYRNECLEIDADTNDFFSEEKVSIYAEFGSKRYTPVYNGRYSLTKCFGVTFNRMKTFHVSIPVPPSDKERVLRFFLSVDGHTYQMKYEFPSHTSRFNKKLYYAYWRFGNYFSYWKNDGIHVTKARRLTTLYKELRLWKQMYSADNGFYRDQLPEKILSFLLRPYFSRRKIWLFLDKIYKGGDSSEYIYRYACEQKDGIHKYYLLDKSSADYKRMRKEGYKPLVRGSLKHRLIFLNANMVIASNSTIFAFNDYTFERSFPIRGDIHFDVACVQHGMSVQKIALAQQRLRDNIRLYFCASKYEIENLMKPVYDYAGYDILKLTGVPRYDGLKDRAEKILLISPTWRMNSALPITKNEGVSRDYNPNFRETDYFKVYNSLINNPRLLQNARKYGYRIQYVLHPIVSPQHDDFTKNDLVEIIPSIGDMSYEKLFCEAALMVTDFSGVQFDFAYMRKPVVYLHHDDIPQHYEEGTFHYSTMAFGEICHTNEELIDVLCSYMENGCEMPDLYRRRADDFFEFSDNNNCARIYPVMLEHERNR